MKLDDFTIEVLYAGLDEMLKEATRVHRRAMPTRREPPR